MKKLWPEFLVLGLFLLGDVVWDGLASAAAGAGAGILAYLVLLFFKIKKPGLIVEGLLFGGITALGEFVDFPGGTIILMELVLGAILLVSMIIGRNLITALAGGLGKGLFSRSQYRILSMTLGSVFLLHAALSVVMALYGFLSWWSGGILFLLLYFFALGLSRSGMKNAVVKSMPELVEENEGNYRLEAEGRTSGKMRLAGESSNATTIQLISMELRPHEFLRQLEIAMKRRGVKSLAIDCWDRDEIELEIQGYVKINEVWKKRI
ncbi:MAG: hypothetical protein U9P42_08880 [Candidatus Fermentibacteria bacterium]|nr:hypothetical protein [Candidatus Fermentibacteria bacterium]